jgi:hypothetical protein
MKPCRHGVCQDETGSPFHRKGLQHMVAATLCQKSHPYVSNVSFVVSDFKFTAKGANYQENQGPVWQKNAFCAQIMV